MLLQIAVHDVQKGRKSPNKVYATHKDNSIKIHFDR